MFKDIILRDIIDSGENIWGCGRYNNFHHIQSAPWEGGTPMRRYRPRKPKNRAYKRAKTKAQRVARRSNRR